MHYSPTLPVDHLQQKQLSSECHWPKGLHININNSILSDEGPVYRAHLQTRLYICTIVCTVQRGAATVIGISITVTHCAFLFILPTPHVCRRLTVCVCVCVCTWVGGVMSSWPQQLSFETERPRLPNLRWSLWQLVNRCAHVTSREYDTGLKWSLSRVD